MIGEYEEVHSHADMYPIDMMVGYLRSIIGGQLGGSSATISAYDASVVNATESFQLAQMMDGMLSTYLEQVKDRVSSCEEFYELQQQQWQESIRLRTEEGIVKTLVGVGTMILGGMLVVATCGMALPLVATVGVMAIGAGTVAYGFSNTVEGGQDVYAGVTGDPRLVSVNPIRDTVFASNPDLYYLIGNVLTIAASLLLTGGMAANAAVSAGTSIGRAVVTEYAKQGLTMAASSYVEKSMTEATNSPLAGFVVGSLTGIATYGTLSEAELEVVNNVKRPQQLGNVRESGFASKIGSVKEIKQSFTREDIINFLDGVTEKSTEIANAIQNKDIGINVLGDELFENYLGCSSDTIAMQIGEQIYVRSSSDSLLSDIVHEGTHAMDYYNGIDENIIASWTGEITAYNAERLFQIEAGMPVQFESEEDMMVHIWSNYNK